MYSKVVKYISFFNFKTCGGKMCSKHDAVNQMIARLRAGEHCAEVRLPGEV